MKIKPKDNEIIFKTEMEGRAWVQKNVIKAGGKLGEDNLYQMKDGTRIKLFLFGAEIIAKGGKPATGNMDEKVALVKVKKVKKVKPAKVKRNKNGKLRKARSDKGKKRK